MHPPEDRRSLIPYLALGFAVTVWGASFVAASHLLKVLDPLTLATARFTIASLFFAGPFVVALKRRTISGRDLLRMAFLGQLAFSTYFWLQYTGVKLTNSGIAAILVVGLLPCATALLAPLGGDPWPGSRAWAALAIGFLGVAAVTWAKPPDGSVPKDIRLGALCLIANAFGFAVYSLLTRKWMKGRDPMTLTGGAMIFGSLGLILMCLASGPQRLEKLVTLDATQLAALGFLTLFCSVAGYFAWSFALSRLEASRATVWIYGEPIVAMGLAHFILHERYGKMALAGAAAIAVSVAVVTWKKPGNG